CENSAGVHDDGPGSPLLPDPSRRAPGASLEASLRQPHEACWGGTRAAPSPSTPSPAPAAPGSRRPRLAPLADRRRAGLSVRRLGTARLAPSRLSGRRGRASAALTPPPAAPPLLAHRLGLARWFFRHAGDRTEGEPAERDAERRRHVAHGVECAIVRHDLQH